MSSEAIRPSTIEGIKRLAKSLKIEHGIQHTQALDAAAQTAGFQNFRHAGHVLRSVTKTEQPCPSHRIFLTSYWRDGDGGETRRETLSIWLSVPWCDLITPPQFQNHRALGNFRAEGPDHLARKYLQRSQSEARRSVCAAARALHFMDATKLRPSKSHSRAYPGGRSSNSIPGCDHYSIWYDPRTKRYLFADEPYEKAVEGRTQAREAWAKEHGFTIVKPEWTGMYAPDLGSRLYLIADETKGIPLQPIAVALNKLSSPIVETAWNGESTSMTPLFVSPGSIAKATAAKIKEKTPPKKRGQCNSVGYVYAFVGPRRRPKGQMLIAAHAQVGHLLKSVLHNTYHRKGVYNRINTIRSELDEWAEREHGQSDLSSKQFLSLYYLEDKEVHLPKISDDERKLHIHSIDLVKNILSENYPDCQPLRALIKMLDGAINSLSKWK